jgi:NADH-quinone oxidoreductase subunit I
MAGMYGKGILKGLKVSFNRFVDTYLDDLRWIGKRYRTEEGIAHRGSKDARGIFTVQYPEEKIPVPEEFRVIPFLVYNEGPNGEKNLLCTSCGICSKVCPPQCIWITRSTDPTTGRPIPDPAEFYIETNICMNCGLCAEYCPFDAIKMDHNYELASFGREIYDKARLSKPTKYYESIRPDNAARENAARAAKQAARTGAVKAG